MLHLDPDRAKDNSGIANNRILSLEQQRNRKIVLLAKQSAFQSLTARKQAYINI